MALKKKNKYWWGYSSYITHTIINCYNHWGKVWQFLKKLNRITTRPSNSLESSLGLQGDQTSPSSWIFTGRTDAEANAPVLWPPDAKSPLIGTDLDAVKDWGQEKKQVTEDEIVGWHHWLNGNGFQQALGDSEGQGSLECCSPWGCKDLDRI